MSDTTDPTGRARPEELGFAGCLAELDRIVADMESDSVDVDHLSAAVERATELVDWCRSRLHRTRLRVDEVLVRLEETPGSDADGDPSDGDPPPEPGY